MRVKLIAPRKSECEIVLIPVIVFQCRKLRDSRVTSRVAIFFSLAQQDERRLVSDIKFIRLRSISTPPPLS